LRFRSGWREERENSPRAAVDNEDKPRREILLSEMNAEQLAETTMNPLKRTLLCVRLEDAVKTEEIFVTLMGEDAEARRKFIEDNALDVKNLDV